jgi:hypothetical protein
LVLFVNDSEYSKQIDRCETYFISWLYLSRFPWRALLLLWQLAPLIFGEEIFFF